MLRRNVVIEDFTQRAAQLLGSTSVRDRIVDLPRLLSKSAGKPRSEKLPIGQQYSGRLVIAKADKKGQVLYAAPFLTFAHTDRLHYRRATRPP